MDTQVALDLINNQMIYKPGWTLAAEDYSWRMQGGVLLHVAFAAPSSDRDDARNGYNVMLEPLHNAFPIIVQDCTTEDDLIFRILRVIIALETHEAREFLRRKPTYDAPFHPHRIADMTRWAEHAGTPLTDDLNFGAYARRPAHLTVEFTAHEMEHYADGSGCSIRRVYSVPVSGNVTTEERAKAYDPQPVVTRTKIDAPREAALLHVIGE